MTSDGILVLQTLFDVIWRLFTSWTIPGTKSSPAEWFVFIIATGIGIKVIRVILPTAADSYIGHMRDRFNNRGSGGGSNLPDVR